MSDDKIRLEILQYSYWEHYKLEKDLSFILPIDHPKRKLLSEHREEILSEINELKSKGKNELL